MLNLIKSMPASITLCINSPFNLAPLQNIKHFKPLDLTAATNLSKSVAIVGSPLPSRFISGFPYFGTTLSKIFSNSSIRIFLVKFFPLPGSDCGHIEQV